MCLGIIMQVRSIDALEAVCEAKGVRRTVSLFLLSDEVVAVGDFVIVHVGYALQRVAAQEADDVLGLHEEADRKLSQAGAGPDG